MTSSSDREQWRPLSLSRVELRPGAGVVADAAPRLTLVRPGDEGSWLPSFSTDEQTAESRLVEEAYRHGREEATKAERARAEDRCRTALQAVAKAAAHLEEIAGEFAEDRERDLQAVAMAVARSIVRRELTVAPEIVGELVTRAITLMPLDHELEVRIHPDDLATLGAGLDSLVPAGRSVRLQWVGDETVERGGFLIESPARIVDGRTDVALRVLYERFEHE